MSRRFRPLKHTHSVEEILGLAAALSKIADGSKGDITVAGLSWTINSAAVQIPNIDATGTPSASTFLRGDGSWATPAASVADGDKGDINVTGSGANWALKDDTVGINELSATGTPSNTTYLRGDNTWASPPGGGEAFPVGSVFIAVVSTNPGTLLGYGTWSAFATGRMLIGIDSGDADFDTAEETGGAKTVTLTAAQSGLPQHTHSVTDPGHTHPLNVGTTDGSGKFDQATTAGTATLNSNSATTGISIQNAGPTDASQAHNNMPPYIAVYMWKRTA